MPKYIVQLERIKCIGAAACQLAAPEFWKMAADGKIDLIGGAKANGMQTREIDEKALQKFLEAAESCPVNAIHIINKGTGERLI